MHGHSQQPRLPKRPALSRRKKACFAVVTLCVFFVGLEGLLALLSVQPPTAVDDPLVGFSGYVPLFTSAADQGGQGRMQTASGKLIWFNDQSFSLRKPSNTRRVFCLGGSTTYGRPYSDKTSFVGWLRRFLPKVDDTTQWEVVNAGGISYASYRVAAVMEELTQYQPDLFVVYCGHNEFLERRTYRQLQSRPSTVLAAAGLLSRTRVGTVAASAVDYLRQAGDADPVSAEDLLPAEVDERLNHSVGPEDYHRDLAERAATLVSYRANLLRMVAIAKEAGVELLFIVPAANEKDCAPFKSELSAGVSPAPQAAWDQLWDEAVEAQQAGDTALAERRLTDLVAWDPGFARTYYALGQVAFAQGQTQAAHTHFRRAVDEDVCPLRAPSEFLDAIRDVAEAADVPLVDFDQRLRTLAQVDLGHRVLGSEYFLDHVHPTIEAHRNLAAWIIEVLLATNRLTGRPLTEEEMMRIAQGVQLDPLEQGVALRNLAKVLHWAGKFSEAEPHARQALDLLPGDPESQLILADCLWRTDRRMEAIDQCEQLLSSNPLYPRGYQYYGDRLMELGEYSLAREYLQIAVEALPAAGPHWVRASYSLGLTCLRLGEAGEAERHLSACLKQTGEDPHIQFHLAEAKASLGQSSAAIELYQQVLTKLPTDSETMTNLGLLYLQTRQFDQAIAMLQAALDADEENERARSSLEVARQLANAP